MDNEANDKNATYERPEERGKGKEEGGRRQKEGAR